MKEKITQWKPNKTLIDLLDEACSISLNESQYKKFQLRLIREIRLGTKNGREMYDIITAYLTNQLIDDEAAYKKMGGKLKDYLH